LTVNSRAGEVLRKVIDDKKSVMVRFPPDLWVKAIKKKNRMADEAADHGNFENISIHTVVIEALRAFVTD
jgi:hypothetical protein